MEITNARLPALVVLGLLTAALAGTAVSAGYLPGGGFLSTKTSVSVTGTVNDTVYVKYATLQDGLRTKTTWESSYITYTPERHTLSSQLTLGSLFGKPWWVFQRIGFPTALLVP